MLPALVQRRVEVLIGVAVVVTLTPGGLVNQALNLSVGRRYICIYLHVHIYMIGLYVCRYIYTLSTRPSISAWDAR